MSRALDELDMTVEEPQMVHSGSHDGAAALMGLGLRWVPQLLVSPDHHRITT